MYSRLLGNPVLVSVWLLFASLQANSQDASGAGPQFNNDGTAQITIAKPHTFAPTFLDSDDYTGSYTLQVEPTDQGKFAAIYVGGLYNGQWFLKTPSGWLPWDSSNTTLTPYTVTYLQSTYAISVFQDEPLPAGEFQIYAAYQVFGQAPVIGAEPLSFTVHPQTDDTLHPFTSDEAMEMFLEQGLSGSASNEVYASDFVKAVAVPEADSGASQGRVSATNIQESGVDEADSIKTDGEHLFVLRNCVNKTCLATFALDSSEALATELASIELSGDLHAEGMYLVKDTEGDDLIITVAGRNTGHRWFDVWQWAGNRTKLQFLNANDPANLEFIESLTIDGQLISSRRVDDVLYLVTRYTPFLEGYQAYAYDDETAVANDRLLSEATLFDLVPKLVDSQGQEQALVNSEKCYLPTKSIDKNLSPSVITITAIPLDQPTDFTSTCFLGETEAVYMTPDSLYLATTQFNYNFVRPNVLFYNPEHKTGIHKFALGEDGIDYRGSGQVKGHLGWSEDKKSFRMGENGSYLNVVTSIGDTWNGSSSTRLSVLNEAEDSQRLKTVNVIDGIGKPGEQLYAARFFGDTGYLVTFRLIDPLYVLDLSDQENPKIVGELEIDGYSDYLHPVADGLILGIGKDAIPDDASADFEGNRGAWYQGLKLSLFDVSDPANPGELDSMIIGKRGTDSPVLRDHHALSFLPPLAGQSARLAIPVSLHDTVPTWPGFDPDSPSSWYDYTHTGLYSFEISSSAIKHTGILFGSEQNSAFIYNNFSDRSVLLDDAVFYVNGGNVSSSHWAGEP